MNLLDMKTLILNQTVTYVICTVVVGLLWQQNRRRFQGLGYWLASFALSSISIVLIILRGAIPDWLSIVIGGSALPVGSAILLYIGLEKFVGLRSRQWHNLALLLVSMACHTYFTYVQLSLQMRNVTFSIITLLIDLQIAWLMLRRVSPAQRPVTRQVGYIFIFGCLIHVGRIAANLTEPAGNDFLRANATLDTVMILLYQIVFYLTTFSLFLMINKRLFLELQSEHSALQNSETRHRQLVEFSPNALFVFHDGRFDFVNPAGLRLLRASRPEQLLGKPVMDFVHASYHAIVSQRIEQALSQGQAAPLLEERFIRLDGTPVEVEVTTAPIEYQGQPALQSIVRDITERKRAEAVLNLRPRLIEFAADHSLAELMQKALDEIGELTDSPIGFYHFVEADQNTLNLQAWSTRTQQEFCKAEGAGMHYDLDQAGVWVECIYTRQPVIHNDYAALPNRKGMPEGHAEVRRELVVPTISNGQIVSILGVGNKPTDYDETDVALVSYVAGVIWAIVERKQLEANLEKLATTDSLTGAFNRRQLTRLAESELARAQRYAHPTAVIMLDIDHFKQINDTYGHFIGDRAIQVVAQILFKNLRAVDSLGRYGGDEFMIVLPETNCAQAQQVAERMRAEVDGQPLQAEDQALRLTITLGVTCVSQAADAPPVSFDTAVLQADKALYLAKEAGRNCVRVCEAEPAACGG